MRRKNRRVKFELLKAELAEEIKKELEQHKRDYDIGSRQLT